MSERRNRCILIVEDEPGDARLLRLALKQSGHTLDLYEAGDGHEALRFLRREGEPGEPGESSESRGTAPRPDLILLDLKMPGQGGLEFLDAIKQDPRLRAIPVVVVTTSALEADVLVAYQRGVAGFVGKPADLTEFIAAIDRLCHYWFARVRLPEAAE
jgi:CheY-like chemotaxis protein